MLRPLPDAAQALLADAPPRLRAHLALVHDVACTLVVGLRQRFPGLIFDGEAVQLGAAVHDIGKKLHPEELSRPGHAHEEAGRRLLEQTGWPEKVARFAATHGGRGEAPALEDLLVRAADVIWKGKRDATFEEGLVQAVVEETGQPAWEAFCAVDELLTELAAGADERLAWQSSFPVR